MGSRLATWSLSGVQSDAWRVYSSLTLPDGQHITTVDCKSGNVDSPCSLSLTLHVLGLLAVGTPSSLSVYTLMLENDLPTWSLKWSLPYVTQQSWYESINGYLMKDCRTIASAILSIANVHRQYDHGVFQANSSDHPDAIIVLFRATTLCMYI